MNAPGWAIVLASLVLAVMTASVMAAFDAPTWAWLGAAIIVYLSGDKR